MATGEARPRIDDPETVKAEWLGRLDSLVDEVEGWARASGWRTRRIGKTSSERRLGTYRVPVLLMEKDTVEVVLNPVARFVPGADGAVDLYDGAGLRRHRQPVFRGRSLGRALRRTARPVGHARRGGDHAPILTPSRRSARSSTGWPPMAERQAFIDRVKGAERESYVVTAAVTYYRPVALAGDARLPPKTSPRDLVAASHQVESTYMVRMWAEFETCSARTVVASRATPTTRCGRET